VRLLFDTNVLFAAHIANGLCARLYERALAGETLVSSSVLMAELEEKLVSKAKIPLDEAAQVRAEVETEMELVAAVPLPDRVCRDPDDDAVLAAAIAGQAEAIVTGDKGLLVLRTHAGIPIITPAQCAATLGIS